MTFPRSVLARLTLIVCALIAIGVAGCNATLAFNDSRAQNHLKQEIKNLNLVPGAAALDQSKGGSYICLDACPRRAVLFAVDQSPGDLRARILARLQEQGWRNIREPALYPTSENATLHDILADKGSLELHVDIQAGPAEVKLSRKSSIPNGETYVEVQLEGTN